MTSVDDIIKKFKDIGIGGKRQENADSLFNEIIHKEDDSGDTLAKILENPQIKSKFVHFLENDKNNNAFSILLMGSDQHLSITTKLLPELPDKTTHRFLTHTLSLLHRIYYKDFVAEIGINSNPEDVAKTLTSISKSQYLLKFILSLILQKTEHGKTIDGKLLQEILPVVILYTDRRFVELGHAQPADKSSMITSQVVLILSKCIELQFEKTEKILISVIQELVDDADDGIDNSKLNLIIVFSFISLMFHINTDIGEQIFILDEVQFKQFTSEHLQSQDFVIAALEALSSACVSKKCRALVAQNFSQLVETAFESSNNQSVQLIAASVLVKTKANSETNQKEDIELLNEFSTIFEDAVSEYLINKTVGSPAISNSDYQIALEGLAYTSLLTSVKLRIGENKSLITNLVDTVKSPGTLAGHSVWIYCSLCILVNITNYRVKLSAEEKRLRNLKNYAGKSNLETEDESDSVVDERNKIIIESGIVGAISQNCPRFSKSSKETVCSLFRNLVTDKSHRSKFVQQGGLAVLLYLLLPTDSNTTTRFDGKTINIATSALAKSLISIDPNIAFSSKLSPLVAIRPLIEQLQCEASDIPLLDSFEALLALTNIASVNDSCRNQIIRFGWTKLETSITSSNTLVQQAVVELICNLAMSPLCAEKYLDGSKPATSKLELLAAFTDSDNLATATAAAGALALLSEWGQPAVEVMGHSEKCIKHLIYLLSEENIDLSARAISAIRNLAVGAQQIKDQEVVKLLNDPNTVHAIKNMLKINHDSEIVSLALETIKILNDN